ncbi:MAG: DNA-directed RNA polymerase subunit omega [Candidatus Gygaella obscura]|nr:DNA-directed RNA polymerase subunit omega [Candidatus Gygaella obscura]
MVTALENLLDKANGSVYKLVVMAAKRALEIAEGSAKLVEVGPEEKPTSVALKEIAQGKVFCRVPKPGKDKKS